MRRDWTFPTVISASRILLIIPLGYVLFEELEHNRLWASGIIVLGVATDFLDGYLARRWHKVSELGKIIDPLADKISIGALAIFLVLLGNLPLWFLIALIVRDLIIMTGGLYIKHRKNIISQSNWPGKIAATVIALYLLVITIQLPELEGVSIILLWASLFMMAFSLILYAQRLLIGRKIAV